MNWQCGHCEELL